MRIETVSYNNEGLSLYIFRLKIKFKKICDLRYHFNSKLRKIQRWKKIIIFKRAGHLGSFFMSSFLGPLIQSLKNYNP